MTRGRPPRLWIIDPSTNNPEDQGIATILDGWSGESRLFRPALRPGDGPTAGDGHDADGVVLMGSSVSVHDSIPWAAGLAGWLAPLLRGEPRKPLLGICYGHQLIAQLAGGEVGFLHDSREKKLGVETTELAGGSLLPGRHRLRVVVSHREEVKRSPGEYRVVARRPGVAIDGLEHERLPVFSFQFHPEAGEEFAGHVGLDRSLIDAEVGEHSRLLLGAFRDRVLAESAE